MYRADIEYKFDMKPSAYQGLIDNVDRDLTFAIEVEGGLKKDDMVNYEEVRVLLAALFSVSGLLSDPFELTPSPFLFLSSQPLPS